MPSKILRRCTLCKKFHASYLVEDPQLGKHYLCYSCWRNRSLAASEQPGSPSEEKIDDEASRSRSMQNAAVQQTNPGKTSERE